jgi:hypothetical protein
MRIIDRLWIGTGQCEHGLGDFVLLAWRQGTNSSDSLIE